MPKEQVRKRGRRKPKNDKELPVEEAPAPVPPQQLPVQRDPAPTAGPSTAGLHPSRAALLSGKRPPPPSLREVSDATPGHEADGDQPLQWARGPRIDPEFPFGELNPDLKAYFKTVEDQISEWQTTSSTGEEREDRQLFLNSVLSELRGNELASATDPETSLVIERLLPSLNDWGRRVIGDAFFGTEVLDERAKASGGNWGMLLRHRFGSHVVQTWLNLAAGTLDREVRGVFPAQHLEQEANKEKVGELPTMATLISNILNSLKPTLAPLLTNAHASPPLRLLFLMLVPDRPLPSLEAREGGLFRSKKSEKFRKGHKVQGTSIFGDNKGKGKGKGAVEEDLVQERKVPEELLRLRKEVRKGLLGDVQGVEWRGMGLDTVGSAAIQLLLDIEVVDGDAETPNSLLDHLTDGLCTHLSASTSELPVAQSYIPSLVATPTGTHTLEAILQLSPEKVFRQIWHLYFVGKVGRLAGHPFANFVVARGVDRLDQEGVESIVKECRAVAGGRGLIKTARTSVLQALVDRTTVITEAQEAVVQLIRSCLDIPDGEPQALVPTLMALKTYPTYKSILTGQPLDPTVDDETLPEGGIDTQAEAAAAASAKYEGWKNRRDAKPKGDGLEPNMQGCLLLQGMVKLEGGNEAVLESLLYQNVNTLLNYAKSPIASHLLDLVLTHSAVPPKYRRRLITAFLGRYKDLAEDRMGSRVADTVWDVADGFTKEKIARSLVPPALSLGTSQYGRFFAMKLNLQLLDRRPDEWKLSMLGVQPRRTVDRGVGYEAVKRFEGTGANGVVVEAVQSGREEIGSERKTRKRKQDDVAPEGGDEIDDVFAGVVTGRTQRSRPVAV